MKKLVFRFDVDTHKCLREGVPNLLNLSKKHDVKFTFFINLGQAIDRYIFLKNMFLRGNNPVKSLSAFYKLGFKDFFYLSMFNPFIGKKYPIQLKKILKDGHEIGLHGGKNHQSWFSEVQNWPKKKIIKELKWAINSLKTIDRNPVVGFASPGWNGSEKINAILKESGFLYVADIHSDKPAEKIEKENGFWQVPTNIAGEPGGVGYIEHCRANKFSDQKIIDDFTSKLRFRKKLAIVYDHPYYAGTRELKIIERMIILGKEMKFEITTIKNALNL